MVPKATVVNLQASIAGDVTDQEFLQVKNGRRFGSPGVEGGGRVNLLTATTAAVTIKDSNGIVLCNATITADTDINPIPIGVKCPLLVTVAASDGTLEAFWSVKK